MYVDYQSHIPQTPIFEETQVACIPYQQKLCDVQYSDVSANRESEVICLFVLVSHSRAYRDELFCIMEANKEKNVGHL